MTVDFRCEKCGKLLNVDAEPGSKVRCPHCSKKLRVPAALASLPRPQISGGEAGIDQTANAAPPPSPPDDGEEEMSDEGPDPVMATMAAMMPWILSVFFHLGLALIMLFIVLVSAQEEQKDLEAPKTARMAKKLNRRLSAHSTSPSVTSANQSTSQTKSYSNRESNIPSDSGRTKSRMNFIGVGRSVGNPDAPFGGSQGGGGNPNFYGTDMGDGAKYIVFVIDRSGSMVTVFDYVRLQMQLSISELSSEQEFHIILFADEATVEGPRRGLVAATPESKIAVVDFLNKDDVRPQGKTTALVALKSAFKVLKGVPDEGKIILLLTDGEFAGIGGGSRYQGKSGNDAVLNWLNDNNKGTVGVHTFLFGKDRRAHEVMRKIAEKHNGEFKALSLDE